MKDNSTAGRRGWVNQPSNNQDLNRYHGLSGIVIPTEIWGDDYVCFYPVSGLVISMIIPKNAVSIGDFHPSYSAITFGA